MRTADEMNINERVVAVLKGITPDRIPFISRMDSWYRGLTYQYKIPGMYLGMNLAQIHHSIGFGQEEWMSLCAYKYRNLELVRFWFTTCFLERSQ